MLDRSMTIARQFWRGAIRISEAQSGGRYPAIDVFTAVLNLAFLVLIPVCLILAWATQRDVIGIALTAGILAVWLVVSAVVLSYGRDGKAG